MPRLRIGCCLPLGMTKHRKRRFQCLVCRRQFSFDSLRRSVMNNPICPHCDEPMHVYKRESRGIKYRCSNYPHCKTYFRSKRAEEDRN